MTDNQVATKSAIGAQEKYCSSCGNVILKKAEICPKCGVRNSSQSRPTVRKEKTVAVLLAIFLSFWTWLYTYQNDSWKFWLNLILTIVTFGIWGLAAWIWAIIDVSIKPQEYYLRYPNYIPNQPDEQ